MSEQTGQFRSAAFGGFHRQDVLDYLTRGCWAKDPRGNDDRSIAIVSRGNM